MAQTARERLTMSDADIEDHFGRFGYRVNVKQLIFTGETVDDFRAARRGWYRAGEIRESEPGLLIIEDVQPRPGRATRDLVVVSFGSVRAVMGCDASLPPPVSMATSKAAKAAAKLAPKPEPAPPPGPSHRYAPALG